MYNKVFVLLVQLKYILIRVFNTTFERVNYIGKTWYHSFSGNTSYGKLNLAEQHWLYGKRSGPYTRFSSRRPG
ncbi:hypothetical protein DPMN_107557 [Dreissena polymorpha]|uniref:Uncharacterized protein n=1 Tax=Dreissena polymorpha TaxID=45954 RepID=A0A9D4K7D4_DREPO|nr:hypothetical protein DPMN_107557 [Dreissena polymorpha]